MRVSTLIGIASKSLCATAVYFLRFISLNEKKPLYTVIVSFQSICRELNVLRRNKTLVDPCSKCCEVGASMVAIPWFLPNFRTTQKTSRRRGNSKQLFSYAPRYGVELFFGTQVRQRLLLFYI